MKEMTKKLQGQLHLITMMNYAKGARQGRNILHTIRSPLLRAESELTIARLTQHAQFYWGLQLDNNDAVWNYAKVIHDKLESMFTSPEQRTFFDKSIL